MKFRTAVIIAVMTLGLSCARYCGQRAYTKVVHEQTEAYEYTVAPEQVWKETRAILGERAYEFPDANPTKEPALSKWQGDPTDRRRYSVRIIPGKGTRLEVHEITELEVPTYAPDADFQSDAGPPKPTGTKIDRRRKRDPTVEWEVLRRLDPAGATRIEQMAAERRDEVVDVVSNGCT